MGKRASPRKVILPKMRKLVPPWSAKRFDGRNNNINNNNQGPVDREGRKRVIPALQAWALRDRRKGDPTASVVGNLRSPPTTTRVSIRPRSESPPPLLPAHPRRDPQGRRAILSRARTPAGLVSPRRHIVEAEKTPEPMSKIWLFALGYFPHNVPHNK